ARVAELLHERECDRLDALEEDRDRDDAGDEDVREVRGRGTADALADLREHVREHEDEQQRLQDRAGDELLQVLPEHGEVARDQRAERRDATLPKGNPFDAGAGGLSGDRRHSRSSLPVRLMKTVSRLVSAEARSVTW